MSFLRDSEMRYNQDLEPLPALTSLELAVEGQQACLSTKAILSLASLVVLPKEQHPSAIAPPLVSALEKLVTKCPNLTFLQLQECHTMVATLVSSEGFSCHSRSTIKALLKILDILSNKLVLKAGIVQSLDTIGKCLVDSFPCRGPSTAFAYEGEKLRLRVLRGRKCTWRFEYMWDNLKILENLPRLGVGNFEYLGPALRIHGKAPKEIKEIRIDNRKAMQFGLQDYIPGTVSFLNTRAKVVCFKLHGASLSSREESVELLGVDSRGGFLFRPERHCDVYIVKVETLDGSVL
ncbi:MAG: hypothetical protein SGCHY_004165 [Lobulomycetales sp.]